MASADALSILVEQALAEVEASADLERLDELRVRLLGKKGQLTERLKSLGTLPAAERPAAGQKINEAKAAVQAAVESRRAALEAAALGPIDAVLLSHDEHADNLDAAGRALLAHVPIVCTTQSGAARLGGTAHGLAPWEAIDLHTPAGGTVRVTAVPGRHGPPGSEPFVGDVTGFVVTWPGQNGGAFYVTGDTVWYEQTAEIGQRFAIGTVLAHLGRVTTPDGAYLTLSAADLPRLGADLGDPTIVPVHVEGWKHFAETRAESERLIAAHGLAGRVRWLEPGVSAEFAD